MSRYDKAVSVTIFLFSVDSSELNRKKMLFIVRIRASFRFSCNASGKDKTKCVVCINSWLIFTASCSSTDRDKMVDIFASTIFKFIFFYEIWFNFIEIYCYVSKSRLRQIMARRRAGERPSYLYNGNFYTVKTASLYWLRAQNFARYKYCWDFTIFEKFLGSWIFF